MVWQYTQTTEGFERSNSPWFLGELLGTRVTVRRAHSLFTFNISLFFRGERMAEQCIERLRLLPLITSDLKVSFI